MPYTDATHAELIAKSAALAQAFTPELRAYLLSLFPTSEGFSELSNRLEEGYPGFLKGDPEKVKEFESHCKEVTSAVSLIDTLAKAVSVKDPAVSETLGLGKAPEKATTAAPPLTPPQGFKLAFDADGHPLASVTKVPGAKGYQVWSCDGDASIEGNWKMVGSSTNCRRIAIVGLNRGKFSMLKVRGMRGNKPGPWSNLVSLDPNL